MDRRFSGIGRCLLGVAAGLATTALGVGAVGVTAAGASPSCVHWLKPVSGSWATAKDWSGGQVPTSGAVCISVAGTYTVTLTQSVSLTTLTVGGTSGTQTLKVDGNGGNLTELSMGTSGSTTAHGVILLQSTKVQGGSDLAGGVFTNMGAIDTDTSGGGIRYIETDIENKGGTLNLNASKTEWDEGNPFTNLSGSLKVGAGAQAVFDGSQFNQLAGTVTGSPVLAGGTLNFNGDGAGAFTLENGVTLKGTQESDQSVTIQGGPSSSADASLNANYTNHGNINLTSTNPADSADLSSGGFQLFNDGTITSLAGAGGSRYIEVDTVNAGTMAINATLSYDDGNSLTNNAGTVDVASGASLDLDGSAVTQGAGTITGDGQVDLGGGSLDLQGTGAGTFTLLGAVAVSGDSAAGQTLDVVASDATGAADLALQNNFTNAGTIEFDSENADTSTDVSGAFTFDNTGTVTTVQDGGGNRFFEADTTNEGTMHLDALSNAFDDGNSFTSTGTLDLGHGSNLNMGGGPLTFGTGGGSVSIPVDGASSATITNVGALAIGGTLAIPTTGTPAVGTEYQLIACTSRTGSWGSFHITGAAYTISSRPTGVTATVKPA